MENLHYLVKVPTSFLHIVRHCKWKMHFSCFFFFLTTVERTTFPSQQNHNQLKAFFLSYKLSATSIFVFRIFFFFGLHSVEEWKRKCQRRKKNSVRFVNKPNRAGYLLSSLTTNDFENKDQITCLIDLLSNRVDYRYDLQMKRCDSHCFCFCFCFGRNKRVDGRKRMADVVINKSFCHIILPALLSITEILAMVHVYLHPILNRKTGSVMWNKMLSISRIKKGHLKTI